ncbi:MAG: DUF4255 domain-containing protein [Acidobacteriota bacterium]
MGNIFTVLELVRSRLNESIRDVADGADDWVILSNIVEPGGAPYDEAKDKVVMFLANIQHETSISTYQRNKPVGNETYASVPAPLYINLYVLFMANFFNRNYAEGLSLISRVISFFQQNPVFTHQSLPSLDPSIDKLTFEMVNLDEVGLNYLLGLVGCKYLPTTYYKLRMIPFQTDAMEAEVPAVQGLRAPGSPRAVSGPATDGDSDPKAG